MDSKISRAATQVVETRPITLAGVDTHPGWHALRTVARRITTPLLPDDYLRLANPLWSARELRGRILEVRRETAGLGDAGHQARLGFQLRLRAWPVHRHRAAGRRPVALALVLVDVEPADPVAAAARGR